MSARRLYLCTPDRPDLERFVAACIDGGVDTVQLREKHLPEDRLARRAEVVQRVCSRLGVPFILNDLPGLAAAVGADGVHVGQEDMDPSAARRIMGDRAIIGLSTHDRHQLDAALTGAIGGSATGPAAVPGPGTPVPVDYISAGPVVATPTKPGRPGTGVGYVAEAVRRSPWPVWVTGGVDPAAVADLVGAGVRHFVVVRWLTEADDPRANARALRRAIDRAIEGT
jgi:thiamine-phosphate pyrophosphorylase